MPTVGQPIQSEPFAMMRSYAFMKQTWSGQWQYQPYLVPRWYQYGSAPAVSRADFSYEFGYINREDVITSTPFPLFQSYRAGPWYVLIATQMPGWPIDLHWAGILSEDQITIDRPAFPSGRQDLTVFGFEHVLDRCFITKSFVKQNSAEGTIDHVLPFNERHERGGSVFGNESGLRDSNGVYRFYDPTDTNEPGRWTNLEIAEYLLQYFVNTLPDGTNSPVKFVLAGQTNALNQIIDTFDFRPRDRAISVWNALNQLIDRRRGLGFTLRSTLLPGAPIYLWVYSQVESPISAGGTVLPANAEQISFSIPAVYPYNNLVGEIPFRYSATNIFDSIEVQSQQIRVCGSYRKRQGTLTFAWSDDQEQAYENAPDDEARATDRFRQVFTYFVVPPEWDWYILDGIGRPYNLLLTANDDGTVNTERNTDLIGYNYMKGFDRDLPLLEGYDYTVSPPVNNNPAGYQPEYIKLLALLPLESQTPPQAAGIGDRFYFAEKGSEEEEDVPSCSVRSLDHGLGIEIKASPNYLIAMNHFNPAPGAEGEEDPTVDYDDMVVTASMYTDVRAHVLLKGISVPAPELKPRLVVELQDCHYWYVAPFTYYDVDSTGIGIPLATSENNAVLRDDTSRLRQVAAYLRWWFSRLRQAVTIRLRMPGKYANPGMLLTTMNTSWTREPINAVVTMRKVDFENGTTELTTSYLELDNMISLLDDPQRRTKGAWAIHDARR